MNQTLGIDAANPHFNRIDKILKNESEATKLEVYKLIYELDLDPEDPIFLFAVMLVDVKVLINSEPTKIKEIFDVFNEEIKKWTEQNVQTLQRIAQKAELTERIAENTKILNDLLKELLTASTTLIEPLQKSSANSLNSISQLKTSTIRLESLMESLLEENQNLNRSNQELSARLSNPQLLRKSSSLSPLPLTNPKLVVSTFILTNVLILSGLGLLFFPLMEMRKQVEWLLFKANRQECLAGIKSPQSPECAGIKL